MKINPDRLINQSISPFAAKGPELEFTGERIVPGKTAEALFREHEARYVFAAQYVMGKDVLDVACGTGIGTSFLRRAGARSAWGLDIDPDVIAFAKARYGECQFAQSEATNLCLPDSSTDVVVSFETLEHLKEQRKFFKECQRVLRPGGLFLCSTPNTTIYAWYSTNPYHVRELATHEFMSLLGEHFTDLALFSQAERVYPLFVLRQVISRSLDRLKLKGHIKRSLGMKEHPQVMREEFSGAGTGQPPPEIRPYQGTWFKQAMYLIAIGHKSLE